MEHNTTNNTTVQNAIPAIAQHLDAYLRNHKFNLQGCDITSVVDFLYTAYTDSLGKDPNSIQDRFGELGAHLEQLPLKENDAIFSLTCELCGAYEKRAFKDALQIGAYLILELQTHNTAGSTVCNDGRR